MDPLILSLAAGAAGQKQQFVQGLANTGVNYLLNKAMQEDAQEFNANEAAKTRDYNDTVLETQHENSLDLMKQQQTHALQLQRQAQDWQTNANKVAMDFSAQEAQANREFQKELSSTAYQRATADLRKAGLNPILAAGYSGASTPTGSTGQAFANSSSSSGASVASAPTGSYSNAHSNANSGNYRPFDHITDIVGNFMSNAVAMAKQHDKFEHELSMLARKQKYDYQKQMREHGFRMDESDKKRNHDYEYWDYRFG